VAANTDENDEDEWNFVNMKMRAFYCLLSAVTIKTVYEESLHELELLFRQLESATFYVVDDLITSGQLDLSGDIAEWKGTTWETYIEECKHTVDYADRPDDVANTNISSKNERPIRLGSVARSPSEYMTVTTQNSGITKAGEKEYHEVQLGFAYLALGTALLRRLTSNVKHVTLIPKGNEEIMPVKAVELQDEVGTVGEGCNGDRTGEQTCEDDVVESNKLIANQTAVLDEAERVLKLASSYLGHELLGTVSAERFLGYSTLKLEDVATMKRQVFEK
jgi:hypothetical protein